MMDERTMLELAAKAAGLELKPIAWMDESGHPTVNRYNDTDVPLYAHPDARLSQEWEGMSLRAHFAGLAMQGLLADPDTRDISVGWLERHGFEKVEDFVADLAVNQADALLKRLGITS